MLFFSRHPDRLWGPPDLVYNGYWAVSLGAKRPGRDADHLPPVSAEIKKTWIYTSIPHRFFMVYWLISRAQGQLYLFYFY
jgi:hypothetical protein